MSKYIWSWYDGEGNYCNKAESLEQIIETVLVYYFEPDEDGSACKVQVIRVDDTFNITLEREHATGRHESAAAEEVALGFLEDIASQEGRPDMFGLYFLQPLQVYHSSPRPSGFFCSGLGAISIHRSYIYCQR